MLFNGLPFLLGFLPAAILIYRCADPHPQLRMPVLVLLSLAFYAIGDPPYIALLVASILVNWLAALLYQRTRVRGVLTAAIVLNLLVLGVFKYTNFLGANLGHLMGHPLPALDVALPLGISFFTFHHVMYLADLRAGKAPGYALDRYALYISFFPQALAGPLVRWSDVMQQFGRQVYVAGWQREVSLGIVFIVTGLFEKIFLADRVGRIIDPVYARAAAGIIDNGDAWLALAFNIQVFFDFAGYSDIAIGLGLLFGVRLPFNFDAPFRATSIQDFWQRWHISLMMFLRDYVFHPLVNNRVLPRRFFQVQYFAAMLLTMVLCGLWHGANWTFVLWGTAHGLALVVCSLWRRYGFRLPALLGWALTVAFVLLTGVLFRAASLDAALNILGGLTVRPSLELGWRLWPVVLVPLVAFLSPASQTVIGIEMAKPRRWLAILMGLALFAVLIELGERNTRGFAYYQF